MITFLVTTVSKIAAVGIPDYFRPEGLPSASRGTTGAEVPADYAAKGIQFIIADAISIILLAAGFLAVFSIINNAWKLIVGFGESDKIDEAKKGLFWAIAGLILALLSYIIMQFILEFVIDVATLEPTSSVAN
jgi:hypothetical protein